MAAHGRRRPVSAGLRSAAAGGHSQTVVAGAAVRDRRVPGRFSAGHQRQKA